MATNAISGRERVCVTCENPSSGPMKLLSYRWRPHGPFFPLLENLKTEDNADLFSSGRVPVCNSCANYLLRQWNDYERKSIRLPIEKRTYRLLSDERWKKLNRERKQKNIPTSRTPDRRGPIIPSYDENENFQQDGATKSLYQSKLPVPYRSKIPRLAKCRREQVPEDALSERQDTTLEVSEQEETLSARELNLTVRTTASKMADNERKRILRKMAEMKFQEELEYSQRKVRKAMAVVHFKERKERIREIEHELEDKINGNDIVELNWQTNSERQTNVIVPLDKEQNPTALAELKENIEREMTIQRQELDKVRKSIKSEIARAMDDRDRRNEDLWDIIMEMNERRRSGRHQWRGRPYSDGAHLNKPLRSQKRPGKPERISNSYGERDSDSEYNGNHSRPSPPAAGN